MIEATPDGRSLRIHVVQTEDDIARGGLIEDFLVQPLPGRRGLHLSRMYIAAAATRVVGVEVPDLSNADLEAMYAEALGRENYERMAGVQLDAEFHLTEDPDRPTPPGEPLRLEESRAIATAAFYWQSVAGMAATQAYLADPEGIGGKALALLLSALGISQSTTSRSGESGNPTQQGDTPDTSTRSGSGRSVRLAPVKPSPRSPEDHLPKQNRSRSWISGRGSSA